MSNLLFLGKRRTILISISIVLVSLNTMFFYHNNQPELDVPKLVQQSIRFVLTIGLLFLLYRGKQWARKVALVLFGLAVVLSIMGLIDNEGSLTQKSPLLVIIFIYSLAIHYFGYSESYKTFALFQRNIHK